MVYFLATLIFLSFLGYLHFGRVKLRQPFCTTVFFGTSALLIFMFLVGILRIMTLGAYAVLLGGYFLIGFEIFKQIRSQKTFKQIADHLVKSYVRPEYIFCAVVFFGGLIYFTSYRTELGAGDVWAAWYDHYYYTALNGKWSDSGYRNYASAYCMIGNGFAYFIATILRDYGSQIYMYSHFLCCF